MDIVQAILLGIVQGLTEFIPISSDGHLTLVPFMLGWDEPGLAFIVATHLGTLIAVVWWFRNDIAVLARSALRYRSAPSEHQHLIRLLVYGTIPAVIVGVAAESLIAKAFERPVLAVLFIGVTGYVLTSSETVFERRTGPLGDVDSVTPAHALIIGVAQASAVLPGISRSGMTIASGMRFGLSRDAAARFSFLLAVPVITGAIVFQLPDMIDEGLVGSEAGEFLAGIIAAGVSGFFAIRWFLNVLRERGLRPFGTYCFFAMVAGLLTALARG